MSARSGFFEVSLRPVGPHAVLTSRSCTTPLALAAWATNLKNERHLSLSRTPGPASFCIRYRATSPTAAASRLSISAFKGLSFSRFFYMSEAAHDYISTSKALLGMFRHGRIILVSPSGNTCGAVAQFHRVKENQPIQYLEL
ncbi:hypothetical protein IF1G_11403 [Cordyceps javanica]|uniref:Uncharacterized protein n=1 Tax=Cordyceps javanica TaxID=43265 RepID=A0A545UKF7_9HYPO|nr:hypothetical protein IF1G_11403 [Cordyceps javanica]